MDRFRRPTQRRMADFGRASAALVASASLLAACGFGSDNGQARPAEGTAGGDLTLLAQTEQLLHLDPQRNYTGEDLAFLGATVTRTLTWYTPSADNSTANTLAPDLATDTGTSSNDAKTWQFTLKDGLRWEDGSEVTCEDVKYGVSRTFATDAITDGPLFAIADLAIPQTNPGTSAFLGPYDGTGQELFDQAVTCQGKTITFNLNRSIPDFGYVVTLQAFAPVKESADTREKYDAHPLSTGPYKIATNKPSDALTLVRNDQWDPGTDKIRKAYPDTMTVQYGLSSSVRTQRLMADNPADQRALLYGSALDPASLATIFNSGQYAKRRFEGLTIFTRYFALNTTKLSLLQRQAILAALPRAEMRTIRGGDFAGDLATTSINPMLASSFSPTDMFSNLAGKYNVGDNGDPEAAKKLVAESGVAMPTINFQYAKTETNDKMAEAIVAALGKADIKVKPDPIDPGAYYAIVMDDAKAGEMMMAGWGPDWANGSTVIPELFAGAGSFNLSRYDDTEFNNKVAEVTAMGDLVEQAKQWAALDSTAMQQALIAPFLYDKQQRLTGSKVGGAYLWSPYGSWGYPSLYVRK
ncbi:MAG: ABC transporter substrate-binding protein [Candidatus Nanopelagicales bacterium]